MAYAQAHPDPQNLKKPLLLSLVFHGLLCGSLLVSTLFSQRGDSWGGAGGGDAVAVGLVGKLPVIPLPRPDTVTNSRTVDTTKGLYKAEPQPKPKEDLDSEKIPQFAKEKPQHYVTRPSKTLEDDTPPPPNAIPYGQGGAPAFSSSQFSMGSASQGGFGFSGPGGGEFAGRFPSYVDAVRNRISSNWLQSTVDPSIRFAPRAIFTFQILRDGTVTSVQMTQSSNNRSVDNSALRAILSSSPVSPLPSGYSGNNVTVEFYFEFHR